MTSLSPVCCAECLTEFGEIGRTPVYIGQLFATKQGAQKAPTGTIRLGFCEQCGHVINTAYDASLLTYGEQYENSLEFSPTFRSYAEDVCGKLIDKYDLQGKDIVEIGCGNGDFLKRLCALGGNRGVGYDPAAPAEDEAGITYVREAFSERFPLVADLICCRQTLEHFEEPRTFLFALQAALRGCNNPAFFFEVPNADIVLRVVWDVIYEHVCYFSRSSLTALLLQTGFGEVMVAPAYDDLYLCAEARYPRNSLSHAAGSEPSAGLREVVRTFDSRYRAKVAFWRDCIGDIAASGKTTVLWGAGSKGISFLNALGPNSALEYVVDINPRKTGAFIPCTAAQIVAPAFLREYQPAMVVLTNAIYEPEVRRMLAQLGITAEIKRASDDVGATGTLP